jgi:capsular polysaccharide biosynthesis protein
MDMQRTASLGEAQGEAEIDLMDLLSLYLAKLPLLIIAFIIGALVAGLYTHFYITPLYTATAKLYMVSASSGTVVDLSDLNLGTSLSGDYIELMKIRPIYEDIVEELDLDCSYEALQGMVSIGSVSSTRVVTVTATSSDPALARDIANAVAEKAVDYLPDLMETTNKPHIAESAILPKGAVSPNLTRNTLRGAMVGLLLALALLTIWYLADDTLKTASDVEKEFGVIPLTVIPEIEAVSASNVAGGKRRKEKKKAGRMGHHEKSKN